MKYITKHWRRVWHFKLMAIMAIMAIMAAVLSACQMSDTSQGNLKTAKSDYYQNIAPVSYNFMKCWHLAQMMTCKTP